MFLKSLFTKNKRAISAQLHRSMELHYTFSVVRDGVEIIRLPKSKNLILDTGLDKYATAFLPTCFSTMLLGNQVSPDPVRRDSGSVTLSQSGTTITASGAFFLSSDNGRLLKYNDGPGTEVYLTYVSATQATASISATISSINGTVWYVNQTALQSLYSFTQAYSPVGGDNGTTWAGGVQTMKRTFIGAAEASPVTYTEIGFSNSSTNTNIFDRDIIVGGVSLAAGDQAKCTVELIVTYSPVTPLAVGNVGTGVDTSGSLQIEAGGDFASIDVNGNTVSGNTEPSVDTGAKIVMATFTLQAFSSSSTGINTPSCTRENLTRAAYTNGSFKRDLSCLYAVGSGTGTVYGLALGNLGSNDLRSISQLLTTPFAKGALQTLAFTWTYSWNRTLVN